MLMTVAQTPVNTAEGVVADDKGQAQGAGEYIIPGVGHSLHGCLHKCHAGVGAQQHQRGQHQGKEAEQGALGADGGGGAFFIPAADTVADKHRSAHGQGEDQHGHRAHDLRADGHAGNGRRAGISAHHKQVGGAVQRLQQAGQHKGQGKPHQGGGYPAFGKRNVFHKCSLQLNTGQANAHLIFYYSPVKKQSQ